MKITIEATTRIVLVKTSSADEGIKCRLWEGETEHGVKVEVLIPRIAAKVGQDLSQFEDELQALMNICKQELPESITNRMEAMDYQNCLCETDKYLRVQNGEGRPKQLYPGSGSNV